MGMLMHNTWLEQQKQEQKKPVPAKAEKPAREEPKAEPVKRTAKRKK